jgi:hypothetical protein
MLLLSGFWPMNLVAALLMKVEPTQPMKMNRAFTTVMPIHQGVRHDG